MPKNFTNSVAVEEHDDGTWTETSVVTYFPPSKTEKVIAYSGLGACVVLALAPLGIAVYDVAKDWKEDRKQRKLAKQEEQK